MKLWDILHNGTSYILGHLTHWDRIQEDVPWIDTAWKEFIPRSQLEATQTPKCLCERRHLQMGMAAGPGQGMGMQ